MHTGKERGATGSPAPHAEARTLAGNQYKQCCEIWIIVYIHHQQTLILVVQAESKSLRQAESKRKDDLIAKLQKVAQSNVNVNKNTYVFRAHTSSITLTVRKYTLANATATEAPVDEAAPTFGQ